MEEKEYRHAECPECKAKVRLAVKPKNYGRAVEVKCPTCSQSFQTTITNPEPIPSAEQSKQPDFEESLSKEQMQILNQLLARLQVVVATALQAEEINKILEEIKTAGFDFFGMIASMVVPRNSDGKKADGFSGIKFTQPFISKDGKLNLSPKDEEILRDLKISPE